MRSEEYTRHAFEFVATETTDKATLAIDVACSPARRHRFADAGRQRAGHAGRHAGICSSNSTRRSTAGRAAILSAATTGEMASATAIAARRARTRPGPASNTTTSGWTSSWHSADFSAPSRTSRSIAAWAISTDAVEEVQYANGAADTPMGAWRAKNGQPEPYGVNGGASATRCTATGNSATCRWRSTSRNTTSSPRRCGRRSFDQTDRGRRRGTMERRHDAALCRPYGSDQRAFLSPGKPGPGIARRPDSGIGAGQSRRSSQVPQRFASLRARTSTSRWTSGTTGTGRTCSANWERGISSRTPWGSRPGCTSTPGRATSCSWRTTRRR